MQFNYYQYVYIIFLSIKKSRTNHLLMIKYSFMAYHELNYNTLALAQRLDRFFIKLNAEPRCLRQQHFAVLERK
ncbi:hypothetical protein SAMN05518855_1010140 [Paenibacillus sp. CF384]|nr:hypothetical protein SAMN05518855_1010140 [Paenibacillus sp. CF384]